MLSGLKEISLSTYLSDDCVKDLRVKEYLVIEVQSQKRVLVLVTLFQLSLTSDGTNRIIAR